MKPPETRCQSRSAFASDNGPARLRPGEAPVVFVKNGTAFAGSRDVARMFNKKYRNVLLFIHDLAKEFRENGPLNFELAEVRYFIGVSTKKQRERIQRDPILSEGRAMMALPSSGGVQETFCLRLDLLHGWLFTIDESRVKDEETRQLALLYKRERYYAGSERKGSTAWTPRA